VTEAPSRTVRSRDGTPVAVFASGTGPTVVLVHGATADHTAWRATAPLLATRFTLWAIDRRGRGASGDAPDYALEREFEDVAAVAEAAAAESEGPVGVVGHSFGGRVGLGAALLTGAIGRLVVYEGAPPAGDRAYQPDGLVERLSKLRDEGQYELLLETFLSDVVGMGAAELAAYRDNPVWPARVAAAPSIVRELEAETAPAGSLGALGGVPVPVLQVLGSDSLPPFHAATDALHRRLADGRVAVIEGARHAAHHTHAQQFAALVTDFLADGPTGTRAEPGYDGRTGGAPTR
jgi:pimeloyl-ACP methyl ester carboxylesterase